MSDRSSLGLNQLRTFFRSFPLKKIFAVQTWQQVRTEITPLSASKAIAMIGMYSALYIVAGGILGFVFQANSRFIEHFIRGALMTGVVLTTRKKWSATMMGVASGIVFVLAVPSPEQYLLASSFVAGLTFDMVVMAGTPYEKGSISKSRLLVAAGISGIAESVIVLSFLYFLGFPLGSSLLSIASGLEIITNLVLSVIGAAIGIVLLLPRLNRMQRKPYASASSNQTVEN